MKKTLLFISIAILFSIGLQAQEWNFGNDSTHFPTYAGVPAGTAVTILGLDITAGTTPTNMGLVEVAIKTFGSVTYHRRFKFNGGGYTAAAATDLIPTVNMPTQRYISFPVDGNSSITVHGITGSSGSARKLFVTDGTNYIGAMDFPAGSDINEVTLDYTGPAATLYVFCNASINLYYMKVTPAEAVAPLMPFMGEDFESIMMNGMEFGTTGMMTVVPNPDQVGNPSINCVKFLRPGLTNSGKPWSGFWSAVPVPVDVTVNKYVHVKVWKSRISPIKFKLQDGAAGTLETLSMSPQTKVNEWEDIVFDFSAKTGTYPIIAFMPDYEDPLVQADDLTMYFDDIYVNNDPAVGSAPVQVIENYETIMMHPFSDKGTFTLIENPDKSGINTSNHVIDFMRPVDAPDWAGFYSVLADAGYDSVDVTTNKYVHVKAWKPRISLVKFKLEAGAAGTLEIASMNAQTKINAWEDFVFDFSGKTGKYPIIGLMLDGGADPLTDAIHIYFDDIMVNNDSNAMVSLTLNVNMSGAGLATGDKVYVAGTFPNWVEPGLSGTIELLDINADGIYSVTLLVPAGHKEFKFFKNAGYGGGEWNGGANRMLELSGDDVVNCVWGQNGFVRVRENPLAGKIQMYPNPVRNELTINSTANVSKVIITNTLGKVVGNMVYTNNKTINTSDLSRGMYFVTFIGKDGSKVTQKLIKD